MGGLHSPASMVGAVTLPLATYVHARFPLPVHSAYRVAPPPNSTRLPSGDSAGDDKGVPPCACVGAGMDGKENGKG